MLEDAKVRISAQKLRGSRVPREMAKLGVKVLRNDDFAALLTALQTGNIFSLCTALGRAGSSGPAITSFSTTHKNFYGQPFVVYRGKVWTQANARRPLPMFCSMLHALQPA